MSLFRAYFMSLLHINIFVRGVAQLVAYFVRDEGVASSSLVTPTNKKREIITISRFLLLYRFLSNSYDYLSISISSTAVQCAMAPSSTNTCQMAWK